MVEIIVEIPVRLLGCQLDSIPEEEISRSGQGKKKKKQIKWNQLSG
jgi:hypothetical protein